MTATASHSGKLLAPVSAAEAVSGIRSGDRVFVGGVASPPDGLIDALTARAPELHDVQISQLCPMGKVPYAAPSSLAPFPAYDTVHHRARDS